MGYCCNWSHWRIHTVTNLILVEKNAGYSTAFFINMKMNPLTFLWLKTENNLRIHFDR